MFGINVEWKDVEKEWKTIIVSIGILATFHYLSFFLIDSELLIKLPWYIPIILTIPLSITPLVISYCCSRFLNLISKTKDSISTSIYTGLVFVIVFYIAVGIILMVDPMESTESLEILFIFNFLINGILLGFSLFVLITFISVAIFRRIFKKKKSTK